jgi:hypothetical protein
MDCCPIAARVLPKWAGLEKGGVVTLRPSEQEKAVHLKKYKKSVQRSARIIGILSHRLSGYSF